MKKHNNSPEQTNGKKNSPLSEGYSGSCRRGVFQNYKQLPFKPQLKERAKELRKAGNLAEILFWKQVRNKQFLNLDFHRQKIIGNYIVDFYCPALQLVVEIDGCSHNDKIEYDRERDDYLESLELKIIHYNDEDVKQNLNSVMENLREYCVEKLVELRLEK